MADNDAVETERADAAMYRREVFEVETLADARRIILSGEGEGGQDTAERWQRETPYLAGLLAEDLAPGADSLVLDYGCGIGRLSRALIAHCGCHALGVDLSVSMRTMAPGFVEDGRFAVTGVRGADGLAAHGLRADAALTVWVLQHALEPAQDLARIARMLRDGARLAVVNLHRRAVPVEDERRWVSDRKDVPALIEAAGFAPVSERELDTAHVSPKLANNAYYRIYEKREAA